MVAGAVAARAGVKLAVADMQIPAPLVAAVAVVAVAWAGWRMYRRHGRGGAAA